MVTKININKIREDINLILFNQFNYGLDKLMIANNIINNIRGCLKYEVCIIFY